MDRVEVYLLIGAAGVVGAVLLYYFVFVFGVRATLRVHGDMLQAAAEFCVKLLGITVYCGRIAAEDGCFVLYNRKGVPTYIPISLVGQPEKLTETIEVPVFRHLRFHFVRLNAQIGAAGDAYVTARRCSLLKIASNIGFSYLSNRHPEMRFESEIRPAYGKTVYILDIKCILSMSVANITVSIVFNLINHIRYQKAVRRHESAT